MKYTIMCAAVAAVMLTGCNKQASDTEQANANAPAGSAMITANAVWKGNLDACSGGQQDWNTCLITQIEKSGSADAVAAAKYLVGKNDPGYISGYSQAGNVGVAEVTYPSRANTNMGTLLIPTQGEPVDVDAFTQEDLTRFDVWKSFVQQHADASPWAPGKLVETSRKDSGQQFVYTFPIQTCHACDSIATLRTAFNFDGQGRFLSSDVLDIK